MAAPPKKSGSAGKRIAAMRRSVGLPLDTAGIRTVPDAPLRPGVRVPPDTVGNLFEPSRPGRAVVRPEDLLAIRLELVNLEVAPGSPPRLRRSGNAPAALIVHHPPQSIAEEVFYETPAGGVNESAPDTPPQLPGARYATAPTPPADTDVDPPPIRARAAGESRVAFDWPAGFECDYTLEGVLQAVQTLSMKVPRAALPPQGRRIVVPWPGVVVERAAVKAGSKKASTSRTAKAPIVDDAGVVRAAPAVTPLALAPFSVRQTVLALRGGVAAEATLNRRLSDIAQAAIGDAVVTDPRVPIPRPSGPKPALPAPTETALELPWRLIVSPHAQERWRHASQAVTSPATHRTELWHTRLAGPAQGEQPAPEPPHPDANRTVRAVWATGGPWSSPPMQSEFPQGLSELPAPGNGNPFLATLEDYDRYQIAHLSSNFSMSNYAPQPVEAERLALSALGGWLDARGDWEPPGLDVESWVHRASMGRDHYVRVVYRGVLFPFGHRAVLIKVSERKFHPLPGRPAYLRQRMFMIVRERERRYDDAGSLRPYGSGSQRVSNEFPFSMVRLLTTVTPDLDPPKAPDALGPGQQLFWPMVGGQPFRFRLSATDLDGRGIEFDLPMIFMSNVLASPRKRSGQKLVPLYTSEPGLVGAAQAAAMALAGWNAHQSGEGLESPAPDDRTFSDLKRQRVAMAPSAKAGDTAIEAVTMTFGAHVPDSGNAASVNAFKSYSQGLSRPMFFPRVVRAQARIAALAQLSGSAKNNLVRWNPTYADKGFDGAANKGEVFVDVVATPHMANLDFSKQGDRSGGFVMPNLRPSAISRALGPAAGNVADLLAGAMKPAQFFPNTPAPDLPLPLLFGCIPLSAVIEEVGDVLGNLGKVPKFVSEASTKVESFVNDMLRLYQFVTALAEQPASLAEAAFARIEQRVADLVDQAAAFGAAEAAPVIAKANAVQAAIDALATQLHALSQRRFDVADPLAGIDLSTALDAPAGNGQVRQTLTAFRDTVEASSVIPAGFRQQVGQAVAGALDMLGSVAGFFALYAHGKALFDALKDLLDNPAPGQSIGELLTHPDQLAPKLQAVADALGDVRNDAASLPLLEGAPRKALLDALDAVKAVLDGDLLKLLENLLGEELVIRFDWKPEIKSWGFDSSPPLFVVHDKHAFIVAVEARVKKSGGAPKISVLCGLHHFDLVLIAPASFIELHFRKIEFSIDPAAKMNVDVLLDDILFVGPLSFVETLRDLIPLDGFSDPPHLDITPQGIDAGFSMALPSLACGVLNLSNLSLGAGFTVPFIGQPLAVRFNFCTREQPFHLTVYMFGGGGFFGITLDPHGVQILEAAFEFGAAISVDFGVASGGVSVMAGIYYRMEADAASLTGYFRLEGHVDVLGLITASLELYLELRYEFETGKAVGRATLTIEISVFVFSGSVTISCERKFAGSSGDPTFRQLMGLSTDPALPLADELAQIDDATAYAWRDYCEAFA
jgi:hypothetical protein